MILSCPDVHLIYINDISLLTVCLNSLIRELAVTYVWIVRCNMSTFVMCRTKGSCHVNICVLCSCTRSQVEHSRNTRLGYSLSANPSNHEAAH